MARRMKIIIADDDVFLANIYRVKFELAGFEAYHAVNSKEVVKLTRKIKPDIIISDIEISGFDGFELMDLLENRGGLKLDSLCFIFLTRNHLQERADDAVNRGVKKCLVKTEMTFDQVVAEILEVTEKK